MAELTIRPDEIRAALDSFVKSYEPEDCRHRGGGPGRRWLVTASLRSRVFRERWPTSCCASRTARWASR